MQVTAEEYTELVRAIVDTGINALTVAARMMKEHGDETRAMDLDEAIGYAKAALETEE